MNSFDFQPRTRIVFGIDTIDSLGDLAGEMGTRRALVVSDPGIIAAGHTARGVASLTAAGIETQVFQDFHENPTTDDVEAGRKVAARFEPELIVGLGGGSSMDCAKGINFVHTGGGSMKDYWGVGKALQPMLPMIAIPTTAGTGSEAQSFALISDADTHVKMACGDKKAAFRIAILDPKLTVTQPPMVTALTGIDAISHALETYVTTKRNSLSQSLSREAWRLLSATFVTVIDQPGDLEARGSMQMGACFAGLAIENSMLGAAHALANPVTAHYGIAHGQAVGLMLPHVVRHNAVEMSDSYTELLQVSHRESVSPDQSGDRLAEWLTATLEHSGLKTRLTELPGLENVASHFEQLAADAATQWTGQFNPRTMEVTDFHSLYEQAM